MMMCGTIARINSPRQYEFPSRRLETRPMNPRTPWKDGVLLMVCNLFVGIGNYAFQGLIGRKLSLPEYGYANAAAGAVLLLSIPVMATSNALIFAPIGPTRYAQSMASTMLSAQMVRTSMLANVSPAWENL
jgi:hypothetical protein